MTQHSMISFDMVQCDIINYFTRRSHTNITMEKIVELAVLKNIALKNKNKSSKMYQIFLTDLLLRAIIFHP